MTGEQGDSAADPLVVDTSARESDGAVVRLESTLYPATGTDGSADLAHEPWGIDNDFEHVHPDQTERFEVLAGELRVSSEGEEQTLTAGEAVTFPEGVPHRHWNPSADPVRVAWERRPAFETEEWVESVYALAQAGHTDEQGVPGPLQAAVLFDAYPREQPYPTVAPVRIQRALFAALAPIGRLAGYEATHDRASVDSSR